MHGGRHARQRPVETRVPAEEAGATGDAVQGGEDADGRRSKRTMFSIHRASTGPSNTTQLKLSDSSVTQMRTRKGTMPSDHSWVT